MPLSARAFGTYVRRRRLSAGMSLRQLAKEVEVSPTYISHIEQGKANSPPTADRIRKIATVLGENSDELILRAGRLPDDIASIIGEHSARIPALIRELADLNPEQVSQLIVFLHDLKSRSQPDPMKEDVR